MTPHSLPSDDTDAKVDDGTAMAYDHRTYPEAIGIPRRDAGQGETGLATSSPEDFNSSTSYYASVSFNSAIGTVWRGHLSQRQMEMIRGQIRGARRRGLKVRYWDTPAWPISLRNHIWHVLMKEGADVLNVDDLRSASRLDWRKWRHEWW